MPMLTQRESNVQLVPARHGRNRTLRQPVTAERLLVAPFTRLAFNATKASPTTPVWHGSMGRRASVCPLRWCRPMPFLAINSLLRRGCDIVITRPWKSTSRNISFVKPMITVSITPVYLFHYFWVAVPIFQRESIVEFYYHLIFTLSNLYQVLFDVLFVS